MIKIFVTHCKLKCKTIQKDSSLLNIEMDQDLETGKNCFCLIEIDDNMMNKLTTTSLKRHKIFGGSAN